MNEISQKGRRKIFSVYSQNYEHDLANWTPKNSPEERVSIYLFIVGLFVEIAAIVFAFLTPIEFNDKNLVTKYLYQNFDEIQICVFACALISLLLHQCYIKLHVRKVDKILSDVNPIDQNEVDFFPPNLINSWPERLLRVAYFFLLTIIAGEIPYFTLVVEKITHVSNDNGTNFSMFYSYSTKVFILSCVISCFIVLIWDVILLRGYEIIRKKKNVLNPNEKCKFKSYNILVFILSDLLSLFLWSAIFLTLLQYYRWLYLLNILTLIYFLLIILRVPLLKLTKKVSKIIND